MKNIHILPTDKPSSLMIEDGKLLYSKNFGFNEFNETKNFRHINNQNIYITSDEEIKEGDYVYFPISNEVLRIGNDPFESSLEIVKDNKDCKKIILTTDQDLITDGVKSIDDDFLKWFVNNPSCERVEVRKIGEEWIYNADVPKEEFKQETLEEIRKYAELSYYNGDEVNAFIDGVKYQSKRMYSEEEVEQIFNIGQMIKNFLDYKPYTFKEALEQFKKTKL
jgi:hypothetical protein